MCHDGLRHIAAPECGRPESMDYRPAACPARATRGKVSNRNGIVPRFREGDRPCAICRARSRGTPCSRPSGSPRRALAQCRDDGSRMRGHTSEPFPRLAPRLHPTCRRCEGYNLFRLNRQDRARSRRSSRSSPPNPRVGRRRRPSGRSHRQSPYPAPGSRPPPFPAVPRIPVSAVARKETPARHRE